MSLQFPTYIWKQTHHTKALEKPRRTERASVLLEGSRVVATVVGFAEVYREWSIDFLNHLCFEGWSCLEPTRPLLSRVFPTATGPANSTCTVGDQ